MTRNKEEEEMEYYSHNVAFANNIELQTFFLPKIQYEVKHARPQTPGVQATQSDLLGRFGTCE
jgi:hypothetical protein